MNSIKTLGILGSGQLARMTAHCAQKLGLKVLIFCAQNEKNTPASQVTSEIFFGDIKNTTDLIYFSEKCDYLTLENEFVPQESLDFISAKFPEKLFPSNQTFKLIGDKLTEKRTFEKAGIPVAAYQEVLSKESLIHFIKTHQLPVILKSIVGGYDGYGNFTIRDFNQIDEAFDRLNFYKNNKLIVEKMIHFKKELAIVVARNSKEIVFYPVVETLQENHICHFTICPANIEDEMSLKIRNYAKLALESIQGRGIFAFEFFLTHDNQVILNESAPRPHNSGHYSQLACQTSQFENHVRSVFDWPLGPSELKFPQSVMLNLLGTNDQIADLKPLDKFLEIENSYLELYGKEFSKKGRKMGHYILCGNDHDALFKKAQELKRIYSI